MIKLKTKRGFTLIELLISMTILVVFLGVVSQSYVSIVRSQQHANEVRKMYSEVRDFMDFVSEEIRLGSIDYDCIGGDVISKNLVLKPATVLNLKLLGTQTAQNNSCIGSLGKLIINGKTSTLALIRKGGNEKTYISWDKTTKQVIVSKYLKKNNVWGLSPEYDKPRSFFSDRLQVNNLTFSVFPDVNPYSDDPDIYSNNATQFQPQVTVTFNISNSESVNIPFDFDFQTTISSRVYSRAK